MIARFFLTLSLLLFLHHTAWAGGKVVYLSVGKTITVFRVDESSGQLTQIQEIEGGGPSVLSPDRSRLYSIGGGLASFSVGEDGMLTALKKVPFEGGASFLDIDNTGRFLASSDYGAGVVSLWAIQEDGSSDGTLVQKMELEKRAHSSVFSPDNRFLLVPATGPNKVFQLKFDEKTGKVTPNEPPFAEGPTDPETAQQPRHIRFHPKGGIAYTTQERELPGVGMWKWDAEKGSLALQQTIVTLPDGFEGSITTADLHLTPDAKFLYVSNRDLTDRKAKSGQSSIVRFSLGEDGTMKKLGHTACEHIPRSFAIDEAGEFLYVAGQMADKFGVYRIDPDTGDLTRIQQFETGPKPSWVTCLSLP